MSAAGRSNLEQRVVSAVVLVAVVLALTWAGGFWYRLLAAAIAGAVLYEWTAMTLSGRAKAHRILLAAFLAGVLVLLLAGFSTAVLLVTLFAAFLISAAHAAYEKAGYWPVAGLAYAGLCAISLAALRGDDAAGLAATLFLFAVVWTTDIAAYFAGRSIGGPKLAPSISPGKTWSGAIGGAVAAVIAGMIIGAFYAVSPGWAVLFVLAAALSVVSQVGDLFESCLKRIFGAKDSGALIPGHGGVMDRVDGLAAAAFALFAIGALLAGPDAPAHAFFMP